MPVRREIWAFHVSTGVSRRNSSSQCPSPVSTSSCSGSGSETPPRAASRASRSSPTSLSRPMSSSALPGVEVCLHPVVRQLGARADQRPLDLDVGALAGLVDLDRPQQRRTHLVGQQRGGALAQHGRVQRDLGVGAVERLAAAVGLDVDGVARPRRTPRRRRSRSGRRSRRPSRSMCIAWSRSRADSGSIVTNGMSVRSSSGSRGDAAASAAARSTACGEGRRDLELRLDRGDAVAHLLCRHAVPAGADLHHTVAGHVHDPSRGPTPPAPYACARADPAAAQRGQDRSPSRQGPRPRLAVLAVPHHHADDAARVARAPVRRRPGQGRRGARPRSRPARPGAAQRRPRRRPDRPRRRDLHRRPLRRPRLRHPLPRGPPPGDRAGGDHELALRHRPARRPDPGLPALRRRHRCPAPARSPARGARSSARPSPRRSAPACSSTSAPGRTPPSGGRTRPWPAASRPCACSTSRPASGRSSATSTRRPRAASSARCSRTAPTPARPQALADTLTRLGWTVETGEPTAKGTQLDVVVTEV